MAGPGSSPARIANVYVDGFNLYHGCFDDATNIHGRAAWRAYRWLDLDALSSRLFPAYRIARIRYFTALVHPDPASPQNQVRQQAYIRALSTIPHLDVHYGRFFVSKKTRPLADPTTKSPTPLTPLTTALVVNREEKGSDVSLATHLLLDTFRRECDLAVVVTNDSDLAEPIRIVHDELGHRVAIVNPRRKTAFDLQNIADEYKQIRFGVVQASQFPPVLTDANGTITKPATW